MKPAVYSRRVPFDAARTGTAFECLYGEHSTAFWLDSAMGGRFSFLGGTDGPRSRVLSWPSGDVFADLSSELAGLHTRSDELPFDFNCGFVGYLGYGAGWQGRHASPQADSMFLFADRLLAVDHEEGGAWLVSYGLPDETEAWFDATEHRLRNLPQSAVRPPHTVPARSLRLRRSRGEYLSDIAHCLEYLRQGESYEICLTNELIAPPVRDPLGLYLRLRETNPAPWSAFLRFGDLRVLSCSPERFLRIDRNGVAEARPMKGTRPRGQTVEEDHALRRELREGIKDRAENLMIVDLLRNDLGSVCEIGSVRVPSLMAVETYATVHQLVSTVTGRLKPGVDAPTCIKAAFPGGSMTGAPKLRTMELLDRLETRARGIYSGSLGYLSLSGAADLNIVIRSLVSTPRETTLGIGGAIVAQSDPEAEFDETLLKGRALVEALTGEADFPKWLTESLPE